MLLAAKMACMCAATMQPCLSYLAEPVNHSEPEAAEPLAALRVCVEARMALLEALSRTGPASRAARAAAYGYLARFGDACRLQHLPPEHGTELAPSIINPGTKQNISHLAPEHGTGLVSSHVNPGNNQNITRLLLQALPPSLPSSSSQQQHAHDITFSKPSRTEEMSHSIWGPGLRDTMTRAVRAVTRKARAEGTPLPPQPQPGPAPGHMALVAWLRSAIPGDAWLLREWGEILLAQRRFPEAAAHFEARTWPTGTLRAALYLKRCTVHDVQEVFLICPLWAALLGSSSLVCRQVIIK